MMLSGKPVQIPNLEALVLFGSKARGDADNGSDTDVAAFGKAIEIADLIQLKDRLIALAEGNVSFSVYSTTTAESMVRSGSLFLWHLKLEGKVLMRRSDWYDQAVARLAPYSVSKATSDVGTFRSVLDDITTSIHRTDSTLLFEAATMFAILRSLGMIVGMVEGKPCFSRLGPIRYLSSRLADGFALTESDIETLETAKLFYGGKANSGPPLNVQWCNSVAEKVRGVTHNLTEIIQ